MIDEENHEGAYRNDARAETAAGGATPASQARSETELAETQASIIERAAKLSERDFFVREKELTKEGNFAPGKLSELRAFQLKENQERALRGHFQPGSGHEAQSSDVRWPPDFRMTKVGLYCDRKGIEGIVCGPFTVEGHARTPGGNDWTLMIVVHDPDHRPHRIPISRAQLYRHPGELEGMLATHGLYVSTDPRAGQALREALAGVRGGSLITSVPSSGWHKVDERLVYVIADGTVLGSTEDVRLDRRPDEALRKAYGTSGTLEEWRQHVGRLLQGNPMAVLAASGAFAAPLLYLTSEPGGGIHFHGPTGIGKSTALMSAVSCVGLPSKGGALADWNFTAVGGELLTASCTDGLCALDEIAQATPGDLAKFTYMASNGGGKTRGTRQLTVNRAESFRVVVLSSGEVSLAKYASDQGGSWPAGADVRMPSVRVFSSAEAWPNLHGHDDVKAFCAALKRAALRHYGTPARAYLERLVAQVQADRDGLECRIRRRQEEFGRAHLPRDAPANVCDVARRLGLFVAAGELAIEYGVLPWDYGEPEAAAAIMLHAWIEQRGGTQNSEEKRVLSAVRLFLERNAEGRFKPLRQVDRDVRHLPSREQDLSNRAGWRLQHDDGTWTYYILPEVWRVEVCRDVDPLDAARILRALGFLEPGDGSNMQRKVQVPSQGIQMRLYAVRGTILEGDAVAAGGEVGGL